VNHFDDFMTRTDRSSIRARQEVIKVNHSYSQNYGNFVGVRGCDACDGRDNAATYRVRTVKLSGVKVYYSPQSQVRRLRWEDEKRVVLIDFLCIPNGTGGKVNEMVCELATSILRHRTS